ncbi:MAG: hypothetical protein WCD86_16935 [Ktedonobacteraceae bacterium]
MPITAQDHTALDQYRTQLLDSMKSVSDDYVLATYNRLVRTLDRRLPQIETRLKQFDKKQERMAAALAGKESVKQAAAAARAARENGTNGAPVGASAGSSPNP